MITAADVGIGVRGKEGTEACRVADIAIGEFKFLGLMTLYYGREWYRKNSRHVCYNFFKNWFHVAAVIIYGAYSYFSSVVIYDIYSYELFNVFFTSVPIMLYSVFDEEYTYEESKKYADIYRPGLLNAEFNQNVYYRNVGQGVIYGFISIIMVFMVLEDDVLDENGRTGYLYQSGAVLFFNIIIIVNFKVLNMCKFLSPIIIFSVFGSIGMYWLVYWVEVNLLETNLVESFHEEWETPNIYFMHLTLIFLLAGSEYAYLKYKEFHSYGHRLEMEKKRNFIVDRVLPF
jgi:phospholipid-transporting ATPase